MSDSAIDLLTELARALDTIGSVAHEDMAGCVDILNLVAVVLGRPLFNWHAESGRLYAMRLLARATASATTGTG